MKESFEKGWQYYVKGAAAGISSMKGRDYCVKVENAIDSFSKEINDIVSEHGNLGINQCKGFVAEAWHASTFNINASLKDSSHLAEIVKSNELGSVDVSTNFNKEYSLKYMGSPQKSAEAQAINYYEKYQEYLRRPRKRDALSFDKYLEKYGIEEKPEELLKSVYDGQYRLIPKEQLNDAKRYIIRQLKIEEGKESSNRIKVYSSYLETLERLTDRITDNEGIDSVPLDSETAKLIVALCKEGNFNAEEFGFDLPSLILDDYIVQQALKSGYNSAVMTLVLDISPKICELLLYVAHKEKINYKTLIYDILDSSETSINSFIKGYISCALTIACKSGKYGKTLLNINSNIIASVTNLVLDSVKSACLVVTGQMTFREMAVNTENAAVVTIAGMIGGTIGTIVLPQFTVIGYMIGSFVGSIMGSFISQGKEEILLGLCANKGLTLFGIVDQDYALSDEMKKRMGLNVIEFKTTKLKTNKISYAKVNTVEVTRNKENRIDVYVLKRGVIGVRKIGYI